MTSSNQEQMRKTLELSVTSACHQHASISNKPLFLPGALSQAPYTSPPPKCTMDLILQHKTHLAHHSPHLSTATRDSGLVLHCAVTICFKDLETRLCKCPFYPPHPLVASCTVWATWKEMNKVVWRARILSTRWYIGMTSMAD